MTSSAYDLALTWTFPQPAAAVFAAWIEREQLAGWWTFPGYGTPVERVVVEPRPGGRWSVTAVSDADASEIPFAGEIRQIEPGSRLVITLAERASGAPAPSELTVELRDTPNGSSMEFHHHGFGDASEQDELRGGYTGFFFPQLAAHLAGR